MTTVTTSYRLGITVALLTTLFLLFGITALGINGAGGDADRMYLAVPAVLVVGAAVARLRAHGMALALLVTALTQVVLAVVALVAGYQDEPGASAIEILGINAMYTALFGVSAWLFRRAAGQPSSVRTGAVV